MGGTSGSTLSSAPITTPPITTYKKMPTYGKGAQVGQNAPPVAQARNKENTIYTQNVDLASGAKVPATAPGSYTVTGSQVPWTPPGSGLNQPAATPAAAKPKAKTKTPAAAPADPLVQVYQPPGPSSSWGGNVPGTYET